MGTFKKLKAIREHLELLPGLKTHKDFDIAIEIGYHECMGQPLTLKRLALLNIAAEATVRRHLDRLIKNHLVVKHSHPADQRAVYYTLSDETHKLFEACLAQLNSILQELG
jgi:DNA-binding MarR family transcriptional regulator